MRRRHLLNTLLSSGIAATAASIFYPILRFIIPPESAESAVTSVAVTRTDDVPPNSGTIFKFGADPGLLIRAAEAAGLFRTLHASELHGPIRSRRKTHHLRLS